MKQGITYVPRDVFMKIVKEKKGLMIDEKASWTRVNGPDGLRVYVPHCKNVSRIDISNFDVPKDVCAVIDLGGENIGNVKQQINFAQSAEKIIEDFTKVLDFMLSLPPAEKKAVKHTEKKEKQPKAQTEKKSETVEPDRKQKLLAIVNRIVGTVVPDKEGSGTHVVTLGEAVKLAQKELAALEAAQVPVPAPEPAPQAEVTADEK